MKPEIFSKDFLREFKYQISWKSVHFGTYSFDAGGQIDRRDVADGLFFLILRKLLKIVIKGDGFFLSTKPTKYCVK